MNQKKFIDVNFSKGLDIFDNHYGYPLIDNQEQHNGPTGKVVDIQGPQAHAGRNFFVPEGKEFSVDIDEAPYLHVAIKAEEGTNTCLFLCVRDKAPREHLRRHVVIGRTLEGDAGIYDTIKGCFDIKDDGQWHEYDFDLRKIREKQDDNYPYYPDADSISIIQFYSWTGTGDQAFYFNDLSSNTVGPKIEKHRVEGHIFLEYGLPAGGIPVQLYSRGLSGVKTPLGKGRTNDEGFYRVSYDPGSKPANLEVHIVDAAGNEIPLSAPKFTAEKHEVLNLVAPSRIKPLPVEYHRLTADLENKLGEGKLADIRENAKRQDLTILHQATGWDARLIALASTASRVSADTGLQQDALYALFRTGLPTDKQKLASVSSSVVEKALNKAKDTGIIGTEFSVENAKKSFETFSSETLRKAKAPGALSTFDELFSSSGAIIDENGNDKRKEFEDLCFSHHGKPAELWQKAQNMGISDESIKGLRLQGKLAYLTLNNAKLTETLQKEIGSLDNLAQLVGNGADRKKDYYKEDAWKKLIKEDLAKNNKQVLQNLIPPAYVGEEPDDRLDAYAADLARKVRLSFPTRVVGRMIENEELDLGCGHDKTAVATILKDAEKFGFELGRAPVGAFVQKNKKKLFRRNITEQKIKATENSVKKLQRLYQITPSNEALKAVLELGFNSAHDVVTFSKDEFMNSYGSSFSSLNEAELVYRKSQQVSAVTHSFFTTAMLMDSAPTIHAVSPPEDVRENARNELIKHYPTMESLFGSLDFCECEHCRSVLSPAAYFVDLLKFLDPDERNWNKFLDKWKETHYGAPYPFKEKSQADEFQDNWKEKHDNAPHPFRDQQEWDNFMKMWRKKHPGEDDPDPEIRLKPYDLLIERRPDLAHLPLTCENTNTVLPYIDVVNEILEYYVANSNLNKYQGHDTANATMPELLAEPQNILPEAYNELKEARYPLALPFDLWLESVRRFFDHFDTPLWQVMEVFRKTDELFDSPLHDRAAIFSEYLGFSPAEYDIFTNPDRLTKWWELYGYTDQSTALNGVKEGEDNYIIPPLKSARTLARRLGVSYNELTEIIQTSFINPELARLAIIWKLGFNVTDIVRYFNNRKKPQYSAEKEAIEKRLNEFDTEYNLENSSLSELTKLWTDGTFKKTLVLRDPSTLCNFDKACLEFAVSEPLFGWDNVTDTEKEPGKDKYKLIYHLIEKFGLDWLDPAFVIIRKIDKGNTLKVKGRFVWPPSKQNYILIKLNQTKTIANLTISTDERTCEFFAELENGKINIYLAAEKAIKDRNIELVLIKINLFVRLWKKLGWTIEETDRALQVFLPKNIPPVTDRNFEIAFGTAFKTVQVYLAHLNSLDERVNIGKDSRLKLLTLWSELPTTGKNPLYGQLFLTHSVLKSDPVFDDPLGNYLSKAGVLIKDHLPAIQAALNLTADEVGCILRREGKNIDSAELLMDNISMLHRYSLLVKALKLSVRDLITFKGLSGLDVFKFLETAQINLISQDHPFEQPLRFIELVEKVKESGFTVEDLNFLLCHHFDPSGKYISKSDAILALMKTLTTDIRRIQDEYGVPFDSASITDDWLQQKLALILPTDIADRFLSILTGTVENEVAQVNPTEKLNTNAISGDPSIRISYDPIRNVQRLAYRGVFLDEKKAQFKAEVPSSMLSNLFDAVQEKANAAVAETVESVLGLLTTTVEYEAAEKYVLPHEKLNPVMFEEEPAIRVRYDELKKIQFLTYRGVLLDVKKEQLKNQNPSIRLANLLETVQFQSKAFSEKLIESTIRIISNIEFEAFQENVEPSDRLDPSSFAQETFIHVSYDKATGKQRLTYRGLLLNAKKTQLIDHNSSTVLENLLDKVQDQNKKFIENCRIGFFAMSDFKSVFDRLKVLNDTKEYGRADLARVLIPFVHQKLTRQLVVATISTSLNANPVLVEALLTDAHLINDPSQPGKPIFDAFTAVGRRGVSISFFSSSDCTGNPINQTIIATADTKPGPEDKPKPVEAKSARLEGYFVVPAGGAYRFFMVFDKKDTEAEFSLDHVPVIKGTAANNGQEISQFVELKPNVMNNFTLDVHNLGEGDVCLLIQSESLPKGTLNRLILYSPTVIERFNRAHILLVKILQLIQGLGLSEREVKYILTHRADFENIDLSRLPTTENDSSAENPETLFRQFLVLADYAHLKRDISAGTDDLIGIFDNAHRTYPEITDAEEVKTSHFEPIAHLTRRDSATIRAVAESLGFVINAVQDGNGYRVDVPDIANVEKFCRLWEALQIVEKLGAPVEKIVNWATPEPDFTIARNLRNTVNARYEQENWQRIAQSIFDKLRQRKRDVLAAYIMHKEGFERIEQLFEYFLIDPGMEPMVQTSRVKLAISTVQLFIQRSLLNLEKNVSPTVINSQHWQWMKRYRVWEANRKIFLFPENWLEPEFRDDKTHLFQELESALLQGDVSNDLVENAFFNYLKKLEELARLDIVTMYNEEKTDSASNILHVIGRTFNLPHKYFYRRYAHQMWTPWEPVTAEIEGDHVVAVVWKDRLHLFWLTFLDKPKEETSGKPMKIDINDIEIPIKVQKELEVQLNWSEYFQGQWTTRESGGFDNPIKVDVSNNFESSKVFIFASHYEDGSILINLGSPINKAFQLVSKNVPPKPVSNATPQDPPYSITRNQPTRYTGSRAFKVALVDQWVTENGETSKTQEFVDIITGIQENYKFSLLVCNRQSTNIDKIQNLTQLIKESLKKSEEESLLSTPLSPINEAIRRLVFFTENLLLLLSTQSIQYTTEILNEWKEIEDNIKQILPVREPTRNFVPTCIPQWELDLWNLCFYINTLIQDIGDSAVANRIADVYKAEAKGFVNPFFYQDEKHSFLVESKLKDPDIVSWNEYIFTPEYISEYRTRKYKDILKELVVKAQVPYIAEPTPTESTYPIAIFDIASGEDWINDHKTVILFGASFLGRKGRLNMTELPAWTNVIDFGKLVNINPGSELPSGSGFITDDASFQILDGGVNVVSRGGMNLDLLRLLSKKY